MLKRSLCIAALLALSGSVLAQDKTLTFDNASQWIAGAILKIAHR